MKQEIISYLDEKASELLSENNNLELSYDVMPEWAWKRKSAITTELVLIGKFRKFLQDDAQ